jgi:hypothetical protein
MYLFPKEGVVSPWCLGTWNQFKNTCKKQKRKRAMFCSESLPCAHGAQVFLNMSRGGSPPPCSASALSLGCSWLLMMSFSLLSLQLHHHHILWPFVLLCGQPHCCSARNSWGSEVSGVWGMRDRQKQGTTEVVACSCYALAGPPIAWAPKGPTFQGI